MIWSAGFFILAGLVAMSSLPLFAAPPAEELAQKLSSAPVTHFAPAPGYSEGPTWRNGELFFSSGGLLRVDSQGNVSKYLDLAPAGTYLRGNGHILICDNQFHALLDLAPDGTVGIVAEMFEGQPLNSLNDATADKDGNVYWTDPSGSSAEKPIGSIFRVTPAGKVTRIAQGLAFPNGIEVDPESKHLYVIESQTQKVLRYALPKEDQPLGKADVFFDLGGSGGDGCAFDAEGNLWVADFHRKETGKGRITVLSPDAKVLGHLNLPSKVVSNLTFGGPNYDEIYCTTGEPPGVFRAAVGVKGFPLHPVPELKILRKLDIRPLMSGR